MTFASFRLPGATMLAAALLLAAPAEATPLTASQIMANYNLVTSGNVSTNSDIEGSAVIGGNLNGATLFNNATRHPASPVLYLYGANQSNTNVNNGGAVHYGSNPGHFNLNGGSTAIQGAYAYALSEFLTPLNQLSTDLKNMSANSTITTANSKATFNAAPNANGYAVFSLTASALQMALNNNSIVFNQNGAKTIVVNVSGSFAEPSSANWNVPELPDVIFNFYSASTVSVGNWEGAILAPGATLTNPSGSIEGFVYAGTYNGGGEIHNYAFTGKLPSTVAPEPVTISLLGAGLVGIVVMRRRKSKTSLSLRAA